MKPVRNRPTRDVRDRPAVLLPPDAVDTIVAVSSPAGTSARAIVRLSGPGSLGAVGTVFDCGRDLHLLPGFTLVAGRLKLPGFPGLDARLYLMRSPRSYTRQDVVELHVPGSPPLVQETVDVILGAGVRLARPGEFTERAFLSGRIDLAQAEAVMKIVSASTAEEMRLALSELEGTFSSEIGRARARLFDLLVALETSLDFADQDIRFIEPSDAEEVLAEVAESLAVVERRSHDQYLFRDRPRVMLVGRTNVGKSSLYNRLVGEAEAIVSDRPGTTRDVLETDMVLGGCAVTLVDAAGAVEAGDELSAEALARARREMEKAALLILVVDGSRPPETWDRKLTQMTERCLRLLVLNKRDLGTVVTASELGAEAPGLATLSVSALTGQGCQDIGRWIADQVASGRLSASEKRYLLNLRQRRAVAAARQAVARARGTLAEDLGFEFTALEVRSAADALSALTRPVAHDEVLDSIFSHFCIGK